MGRRTTCNELISADQREHVIELYTGTRHTYHQISVATSVPIDKIKIMTADLSKPVKTGAISNSDFNSLMAGWTPV